MCARYVRCATRTRCGCTLMQVCSAGGCCHRLIYVAAAFGAFARLVPDMVGPIADGLELGDSIASDGMYN